MTSLAARAGALAAAVRGRAAKRAACRVGARLRLDDRERLRSATTSRTPAPSGCGSSCPRAAASTACASTTGSTSAATPRRRPTRSCATSPISKERFGALAAGAGRLQRRLRRGAARHAEVQHQRLLGAVPPRRRPAVGDDALRAEGDGRRHRRREPAPVRLRRGRHRAALRLRPRDRAVVDEPRRHGAGGRRLRSPSWTRSTPSCAATARRPSRGRRACRAAPAPRFAAACEPHREMVKPFVVRFGERLDEIAHAARLSTRELRALNGIEDTQRDHAPA